MKFKILSIVSVVIISMIILITYVLNKEETTTLKQYGLEQMSTIEVQTTAANIIFVASENSEVTVRASEKLKVNTTVSGDILRITSDEAENGFVNLKSREIIVDIPASALLELNANTNSGQIHVEDVSLSSLKATSTSGDISVKRLTNHFTIINESGNVEVSTTGDSIGESSIMTNSGHINVQFSEKPQAIAAETKSGKIVTSLFSKTSIKSQNAGYRLYEGLETEDDFLQLNSITGNININ